MLHYTSATSPFDHSQLNPRDRYLLALAQAKAAEAEYIAYEAKREEKALLRRLQLQHAHRDTGPFSIFDHRPSHSSVSLQSQAYHPFDEERVQFKLSLLEQEVETRRRLEREASLLREQLCQALRKDYQSSIPVEEQHHPHGVPYKSKGCAFRRISTPSEGPAGTAKENDQSKVGPSKHLFFGLEEQLKDKVTTEICDIVHAILASLADSSASHPSEARMSCSSKGKDRESVIQAGSVPPSQSATSKDVVRSFDLVQSIEAAFESLNDDFRFPSQLDFISTYSHNVSDGPAKGTSQLAFSSRNHPVRYYEQALTSLLAQLDSVDSFGNEALRMKRKEVVCRVENALDELERSIEESQRVVSDVSTNKKAEEALVLSPPSDSMTKETFADVSATDSGTIASDNIASLEKEDVASPGVFDATNTETFVEVTAPSDSLVGDPNRASPSSAGSVSFPTHSSDEDQVAKGDISQPTSSEEVLAESRKHAANLDIPIQATVPIGPNAFNPTPFVEPEDVSAFLLTADAPQSPRALRSHLVEDLSSDWSDVEA